MAVTMNYGAAPTYVKIASYTAAGAVSSYTFTNIPQGYTDLVLVTAGVGSGTENLECYINGDTGNNYSFTYFYGDGTTAGSSRNANTNRVVVGRLGTTVSHGIAHFLNYSSSQMRKTVLTRKGKGNEIAMLFSNVWLNNNPITSLQIFGAGSPAKTMSAGYTISLYGIKAALTPKATGGDVIVQNGQYWYHAFRTTGAFVPRQALTVDYLVVAGGGAGGGGSSGGGGGAGGLRSTVTATGGGGTLETALSLTAGTTYAATVGAGGALATKGSNSVFSTITSLGGGASTNVQASMDGGSGAGQAGGGGSPSNYKKGVGTANQGYDGGNAYHAGSYYPAGGGGGAGAVGGSVGGASQAGNGGVGVAVSITGTSVFYAGGGGGGGQFSGTAGTGGNGGGGAGSILTDGISGTANTGGGGGGCGYNNVAGYPGFGGSGIVIVRYSI